MTGSIINSIPLLPGIRSSYYETMRRPHYRRPHSMEHLYEAKVPSQVDEMQRATSTSEDLPPQYPQHQGMAENAKPIGGAKPPWLQHDDRVLCFYGYCIEKIADYSGSCVDQVRRVVIKFHLSDHSISILEPKTPNSGMVQGEYLKKSLVRKANNAPFSPADFGISKSIHIYGRDFCIVDCDAATRTFYEHELSVKLGPPQPYPQTEALSPSPKPTEKANDAAYDRVKAFWNYNDNYHKVLRFDVSWHDDHPLYPEHRLYTLHYYLEDHTLEIVEPKTERNFTGRGHFALLVSRQRVRRDGKDWSSTLSSHRSTEAEPTITERDLICGRTIRIHSRDFVLENCDDFTSEYYWNTFGIKQDKGDKAGGKKDENELSASDHTSQMHNLLQRLCAVRDAPATLMNPFPDRDSHMIPCDDIFDKKTLRFRAKFVPQTIRTRVDRTREFMLMFYMENDTLSIYEIAEANTGLVGGCFLQRGRYQKYPKTKTTASFQGPTSFVAADFYIGAIITFTFSPYQSLIIIDTDDATLQICESRPDLFPYSDPRRILTSIDSRIKSSCQASATRQMFRQSDLEKTGVVSLDAARAILKKFEPFGDLTEHELITLARTFLRPSTIARNDFLYDDFADVLASMTGLKTSRTEPDNGFSESATKKLATFPRLRSMFRGYDENQKGVIPIAQAVQALLACQLDSGTAYELLLPYTKDQLLSYQNFCDSIFSTGKKTEMQLVELCPEKKLSLVE